MDSEGSEHQDAVLALGQLSADEVRSLLAPVGFADWRAAHRRLLRVADDPRARRAFTRALPHLLAALSGAADPDRVLVSLERFVGGADDRLSLLRRLSGSPRAVEILVTLFAGSQFLTEILLRNPEYLRLLLAHRQLALPKSLDQFCAEAQAWSLPAGEPAGDRLDALRRYHRWELLRIGACDLLDLFDLPAVTLQLSHLAEGLVRACLDIAAGLSGTSADGFAWASWGAASSTTAPTSTCCFSPRTTPAGTGDSGSG